MRRVYCPGRNSPSGGHRKQLKTSKKGTEKDTTREVPYGKTFHPNLSHNWRLHRGVFDGYSPDRSRTNGYTWIGQKMAPNSSRGTLPSAYCTYISQDSIYPPAPLQGIKPMRPRLRLFDFDLDFDLDLDRDRRLLKQAHIKCSLLSRLDP
ncbi:uncharacterized protein LOC108161863 [Drosophila miranda]|uniref:uncharacterized protein LOC108161863 n=1 Tax=Drosophila miranda TaxID=7229 RepID=UPI0007E77E4A|nr:uncharacterized protein LOC108161863 [Drosophila miranda]